MPEDRGKKRSVGEVGSEGSSNKATPKAQNTGPTDKAQQEQQGTQQAQLPPLGRRANIANSPMVLVDDAVPEHNARVRRIMIRYDDLAMRLSLMEETGTQLTQSQRLVKITQQKMDRVMALKAFIESKIGQLGEVEKGMVDSVESFDQKFLALLHVALIRQELRMAGRVLDPNFSYNLSSGCMKEARKWQLDILQEWVAEMENSIKEAIAKTGKDGPIL